MRALSGVEALCHKLLVSKAEPNHLIRISWSLTFFHAINPGIHAVEVCNVRPPDNP